MRIDTVDIILSLRATTTVPRQSFVETDTRRVAGMLEDPFKRAAAVR